MDTTAIGLYSSSGFFTEIESLLDASGGYFSRSIEELELLLHEKMDLEDYEECALIRDELVKRK